MKGTVAVVDGVSEEVPELLVEVVVGTDGPYREIHAAEGLLEELLVLFVGDSPPDLPTDFVELALSDVEDTHEFLLEDLELAELVEPLLASHVVGGLEIDPLLHEFVHFVIEQRYVDDLTAPLDMPGGAAGADQDVLVLEALGTAADHVCLLVMLET